MRPPKAIWLLTLLLAGPAVAQEPVEAGQSKQETTETAETPLQKVQAIIAEYDEAYNAFVDAYRTAEDEEVRQKAVDELYPDATKYFARLWKLAEANVGTKAELEALCWIGQRDNGTNGTRVMKAMIASHLQSPRMKDVVMGLYIQDERTFDLVEEVFVNSSDRETQGISCMVMAEYWKRQADNGSMEAAARAEELFEVLIAEFEDVQRYGQSLKEAATGALFEMKKLGIGKVAPDIEGMDIDGVSFKLSDYRGKVVVLDFWGDW